MFENHVEFDFLADIFVESIKIHTWSNMIQKTYRWKAPSFMDLSTP